MSRQTIVGSVVGVLFLLVLGTSGLRGQCALGDDGFNVGCCNLMQPGMLTLPTGFPNVSLQGRYGCLLDCGLEQDWVMNVSLAFSWVLCDYALIMLQAVPTAPGVPTMNVYLFAKYSRTWTRPGTAGALEQVWRFLVNGDVFFLGPQVSPCPMPPCTTTFGSAHFSGSIDYTCDAANPGPYTVRLDLNHLKGCFTHAPWSSRPLAGATAHENRSYHLVAPQNFVFGPEPVIQGPLTAECIRPSRLNFSPFIYDCVSEERVLLANALTVGAPTCYQCTTGTPSATPTYHQFISGTTNCTGVTGTFSSIPVPGILNGGILAETVGHWTYGSGNVSLTTYFGVMNYTDACTGEGPLHVVAGVGTEEPTPAMIFPDPIFPTPPIVNAFIDLGNIRIFPPTTGFFGAIYATSVLWQLNQ